MGHHGLSQMLPHLGAKGIKVTQLSTYQDQREEQKPQQHIRFTNVTQKPAKALMNM